MNYDMGKVPKALDVVSCGRHLEYTSAKSYQSIFMAGVQRYPPNERKSAEKRYYKRFFMLSLLLLLLLFFFFFSFFFFFCNMKCGSAIHILWNCPSASIYCLGG